MNPTTSTYQPRHLSPAPLTGHQAVREEHGRIVAKRGQQVAHLLGRHRTWTAWPPASAPVDHSLAA